MHIAYSAPDSPGHACDAHVEVDPVAVVSEDVVHAGIRLGGRCVVPMAGEATLLARYTLN